jgi:hypothetical protein
MCHKQSLDDLASHCGKIDRVIAIPEELLIALRNAKVFISDGKRDPEICEPERLSDHRCSSLSRAAYGQRPYRHTYTIDRYMEYARYLRKISEQMGIAFPEVDDRLYRFDEDKNGKL